jgi:hypothetical protein
MKTNKVSVNHNATVNREQLMQMLLSSAYPKAPEKSDLLSQLKSVGSCLTRKFSN